MRTSTRADAATENPGQITGVTLASGETLHSRHVVLAVGHSARDTFEMLVEENIYVEAKPFSIGLRSSHSHDHIHLQSRQVYLSFLRLLFELLFPV